ncbi:hypothetical protein GCM10011387_32500 [Pedobacter quisquiliarum]|jgi:hypothetical protein|uniref:AAA domain (Dynein-related subfamily) n=1 Tax=Pedobacter quisquiliarum TaxID=1834438 RepID=A0A916ULA1_9SPHI|nr:AAA family ATPase [Pedobacter quisquiliarum]GGC76218.1 hypothetical protein GCM10011387_32500 [Pedobacter quisquiliarum]
MKWEVDHDAKLIKADQALASQIDNLLKDILSVYKWQVTHTSSSGSLRGFKITHNALGSLDLNIYVGSVRKEEDRRSDKEKRIQLGNKDPRSTKQTDSFVSKTLILGIYVFNQNDSWEETIIVAWPIINTFNYPSNPSLRTNIDLLQKAKALGFSSMRNEAGSLICAFRPEFIHFYIENKDSLHNGTLPVSVVQAVTPSTMDSDNLYRNKIIYGAPGTGKSFELQKQADNAGFIRDNTIRITFHSSYSYQQFVGTYRPVPIYKQGDQQNDKLFKADKVTELIGNDNKEPLIDYAFTEGPLLKQLINAKINPGSNYLVIIEEINRAPVASVFGDIFQLLDRNNQGESEYEITFNNDILNYLKSQGIDEEKIKLPSNLFIWATMNSADQGVMPLDAAFKRRWSFEYLPLDKQSAIVEDRTVIFQQKAYNWNKFRFFINNKLKLLGIAEDKMIGPFFMNTKELEDESAIKNKLLLYLRDDVVRHNPESIFKHKTFSEIIKAYDDPDQSVFAGDDLSLIEE